jgi:double-stranded uracil-DNA glycosylase
LSVLEEIVIDGQNVLTLRELLRPGLRAVFVGLNPSPVSVAAAHYYQGRLGQRFWGRLQDHGLTTRLPRGEEDLAAFAQGFGFADLVRRPSPRSDALTAEELKAGGASIGRRIGSATDCRTVVFVFAKAYQISAAGLANEGYRTLKMPHPYGASEIVRAEMAALKTALVDS